MAESPLLQRKLVGEILRPDAPISPSSPLDSSQDFDVPSLIVKRLPIKPRPEFTPVSPSRAGTSFFPPLNECDSSVFLTLFMLRIVCHSTEISRIPDDFCRSLARYGNTALFVHQFHRGLNNFDSVSGSARISPSYGLIRQSGRTRSSRSERHACQACATPEFSLLVLITCV
jgi:hypothetical protein